MNGDAVRAILDGRKTQTRRPIKKYITHSAIYEGIIDGQHQLYDSRGGIVYRRNSPFGAPGDHLYVREHWAYEGWSSNGGHRRHVHYHADKSRRTVCFDSFAEMFEAGPKQNVVYPPGFDDLGQEDQRHIRFSLIWKWWERQGSKPSIHMPRWASRITLEVERVWAERIQEISDDDAEAEGIFNNSGLHLWHCNYQVFHPDQECGCGDRYASEEFAELWDSIYSKHGFGWDTNCWVFGCEFKVLEVKG